MVKPRVDPDPGSRLSTPGKLLLRLVKTPLFRLATSGKLLLRQMSLRPIFFRLSTSWKLLLRLMSTRLQIVAVGRYLPRLCKPLAKARLRNERHEEEVLYFPYMMSI